MKLIACILILSIDVVFGTSSTTGGGYSVNAGSNSQIGTGQSDTTGDGYNAISTSSIEDQGTLSTTSSEHGISDEKIIAEILAQVSKDGSLPKDLLNSVMSGDINTYDDDLFARVTSLTQADDNDDDDDNNYGLADQFTSTDANGGDAQTNPDPSTDEVTTSDITNFVINQLNVAKKIFVNAKNQIQEAEKAGTSGNNVESALSSSTRLAAASVITSAKAQARKAILDARNDYLMGIEKAKRGVTIMRVLEKRFRILAVAFAKAREFAGKAILVLKGLSPKEDDEDDSESYETNYYQDKQKFLDAAGVAKSKVAKMKVVEKSFLSTTRALAKLRAAAFTNVRKVRKNGVGLAQVMSMSEMAVKAAVDNAKAIISQALVTARATALAKAEVSSIIAQRAETQAQLAVQLATNALAAAKERTGLLDTSSEIDSYNEDSLSSEVTNGSQQKDADYLTTTATSDKGLY